MEEKALTTRANFGSSSDGGSQFRIQDGGLRKFRIKTYWPGQKGLRRAVEGHPYRFTVYSYSHLYSNSQKLIDYLTIGESPYYFLQPDARRILKQESTNSKVMIERKLWQPKHYKQWSIKLINLMGGIFQEKIVALFGLATIPEIRDHITSITDHYGNSWEVFSHALKDEYFLKDVDRVTKKLFLEWIERPNKNLQATELLKEFERQYSQLSKVEKLTLEPNKIDLFLQAADGELQGKLELLLEDKEEDEGLTTKWKNVEDAVGLLTKKERRKDRSNIPKTVQATKALVRTTPPTMPTVQPSTSLSKKVDMGMEEIIRGMRDLQIKLARLEENTSINNSKNGIICWKDGKIALKDRDDLFQTNFGKRGMRALVQDYLKEHETAARESASYGARVDDEIGGSTETSEFWASAVSTIQEGKLPREELLRTAATIRGRTGWEDPVESLSVHAYIAKSQHEALMEEKRRENFDDTREGNSSKSIKRKRQLMGETGMSHAIHARIYKEEEEVDIGYKQPTNEKNGYNQRVHFEDYCDKEMETLSHYTRKHWARTTTEAIRAANNTRGELYGACPDVKIWIGDVAMEQHFFVQDGMSYPLILGQPYITATRMETKVLDDGFAYARRDYGGTKEEVLSRDEGAFDASFIGILENGNIMYKKVDDFKRKERKRLYDIEGQLCKLGTLQDTERILGVYEENGLEDSIELITSIGLGDNDKIVEIH
uniref:Predicted protein n=1 Tax=Physcomitrium patens TaxID=3218 RepID=A9U3Y0_PHYPA